MDLLVIVGLLFDILSTLLLLLLSLIRLLVVFLATAIAIVEHRKVLIRFGMLLAQGRGSIVVVLVS